MTNLSDFLSNWQDYVGIFILMFSTFLIGYFAAWWMQRNKFRKVTKRLMDEVNALKMQKDANNIETIFTEIKPKIVEVVKETQEELQDEQHEEVNEVKPPEEITQQARTSFITYTKNKPELDFESFGYADSSERDDLTQIDGIGPYIEQKLNEIGIYNFDQISRFTDADIRVVTELIDFFPERIERDNWVGQAKALKVH